MDTALRSRRLRTGLAAVVLLVTLTAVATVAPTAAASADGDGDEVAIEHVTSKIGVGTPGVAGEGLAVETADENDTIALAGDSDAALRVVDRSTGEAVTLTPEPGETGGAVHRIELDLYEANGTIQDDPRVLGWTADRELVLNADVRVEGDTDVFATGGPFGRYVVEVVDSDAQQPIAATEPRLVAVGYDERVEQSGLTGRVEVTAPRHDPVNESWNAVLEIEGNDARIERSVDLDADEETVGASVDVSDLPSGRYGASLTLYENRSDSLRAVRLTDGVEIGPRLDVDDQGTTVPGAEARLSVWANEADRFHWDFGDGTNETTDHWAVDHAYDETGSYEVQVTAELGNRTVTGTGNVSVVDSYELEGEVSATVSASRPFLAGQGELLYVGGATGLVDGAAVDRYHWELGDGTNATTEDEFVRHAYQTPGEYTVTAVADDPHVSGTFSTNVTVVPAMNVTDDFDLRHAPRHVTTFAEDGHTAERLRVEPQQVNAAFAFGGNETRAVRVRDATTGESVTLTPEDGEARRTYTTLELRHYESDGTISDEPTVEGDVNQDSEWATTNVRVAGDEGLFADDPFGEYVVEIVDTQSNRTIAATDPLLTGIGYEADVEQTGLTDEVEFAIPRHPSIDDTWNVVFTLGQGGRYAEQEVENEPDADAFTATVDAADLAAGTYSPTFTFHDPGGQFARVLQIRDPSPIGLSVALHEPVQAVVGAEVQYEADVNEPDAVDQYRWTFGDGERATTEEPTVSHEYDRNGTYDVAVTAEAVDATATANTTVTVPDVYDVGDDFELTAPTPLSAVGRDVLLDLYGTSSTAPPAVDQFDWSFGDGENETTGPRQVTHAFDEPGEYTVTVVPDDPHVEGRFQTNVTIVDDFDLGDVLELSSRPAAADAGATVELEVTGSERGQNAADADQFDWSFGDGTEASTAAGSTEHVYDEPGEYEVTATVDDPHLDGTFRTNVTVNASAGSSDDQDSNDGDGGLSLADGSSEPSPDPAHLEIQGVDRPATVDSGASFSVAVDVANTGEQSDSTDVALEVDGEELASSSVELGGGERTTATLEATAPAATGEVELAVSTDDDRSTAALSVAGTSPGTGEEPSEGPAASEDGTDGTSAHEGSSGDGTPGFGVAAALVALLGGVVALRRCRAA